MQLEPLTEDEFRTRMSEVLNREEPLSPELEASLEENLRALVELYVIQGGQRDAEAVDGLLPGARALVARDPERARWRMSLLEELLFRDEVNELAGEGDPERRRANRLGLHALKQALDEAGEGR